MDLFNKPTNSYEAVQTVKRDNEAAVLNDLADAVIKARDTATAGAMPTESAAESLYAFAEAGNPLDNAPPGLLGRIAKFIYDQSPRQIPMISTAAALGLMAGVAGRNFQVNGDGLNLFITVLAETGMGKDAINSGINKLITAVGATCPSIRGVICPSTIASRPAINTQLQESACFVSIISEFGLLLEKLAKGNASPNDIELQKCLLEVYGLSGKEKSWGKSARADKKNNTEAVRSPAVTLIGEGTPLSFYKALNEQMIEGGLISRLILFKYNGDQHYTNTNNGNVKPDAVLNLRLTALYEIAATLQTTGICGNNYCDISFSPDAERNFMALDHSITDHCNKIGPGVERALWTRVCAATSKLAAICALSRYMDRDDVDYSAKEWWQSAGVPIVEDYDLQWAYNVISSQTNKLSKRFAIGEVGAGANDSKQLNQLRRTIRNLSLKQTSHVITYRDIHQNCSKAALFRLDPYGAANAIKRNLEILSNNGALEFNKLVKGGYAYKILDAKYFLEAPTV